MIVLHCRAVETVQLSSTDSVLLLSQLRGENWGEVNTTDPPLEIQNIYRLC